MTPQELCDRLLDFSVRVGKVIDALPGTRLGRHIAGQLVRSGTAPAPNYEEACAAESRADFVHKLSVSWKELRESGSWLRLISKAELLPQQRLGSLIDEAEQLRKILGASLNTAKGNGGEHTHGSWKMANAQWPIVFPQQGQDIRTGQDGKTHYIHELPLRSIRGYQPRPRWGRNARLEAVGKRLAMDIFLDKEPYEKVGYRKSLASSNLTTSVAPGRGERATRNAQAQQRGSPRSGERTNDQTRASRR